MSYFFLKIKKHFYGHTNFLWNVNPKVLPILKCLRFNNIVGKLKIRTHFFNRYLLRWFFKLFSRWLSYIASHLDIYSSWRIFTRFPQSICAALAAQLYFTERLSCFIGKVVVESFRTVFPRWRRGGWMAPRITSAKGIRIPLTVVKKGGEGSTVWRRGTFSCTRLFGLLCFGQILGTIMSSTTDHTDTLS